MPENKKSVLVVDDEEMIREAVVMDLESQGYITFQASNGHEAWEIFQKQKLDLVITDVRMPNGDGIELLKRIREIDPDFPVILFITGYKDISDEEAIARGVNAIIQKPFTRKTLQDEIHKHLH